MFALTNFSIGYIELYQISKYEVELLIMERNISNMLSWGLSKISIVLSYQINRTIIMEIEIL